MIRREQDRLFEQLYTRYASTTLLLAMACAALLLWALHELWGAGMGTDTLVVLYCSALVLCLSSSHLVGMGRALRRMRRQDSAGPNYEPPANFPFH